ncbi:MAG: GHKL domain-containing protein [Dorea formicigenerans]
MDACNAQSGEDKKIIVRAKTDDHSLCVTIDNTFSGSLDIDQERHFVSSKHEGLGLGTESIKSIAEKYGGVCQFEANNGMFYASVMCFKDHA